MSIMINNDISLLMLILGINFNNELEIYDKI